MNDYTHNNIHLGIRIVLGLFRGDLLTVHQSDRIFKSVCKSDQVVVFQIKVSKYLLIGIISNHRQKEVSLNVKS